MFDENLSLHNIRPFKSFKPADDEYFFLLFNVNTKTHLFFCLYDKKVTVKYGLPAFPLSITMSAVCFTHTGFVCLTSHLQILALAEIYIVLNATFPVLAKIHIFP